MNLENAQRTHLQQEPNRSPADPEVVQERLDKVIEAFMATRPELTPMSLDEWLVEHFDHLSDAERRAATALIDLYMENV